MQFNMKLLQYISRKENYCIYTCTNMSVFGKFDVFG